MAGVCWVLLMGLLIGCGGPQETPVEPPAPVVEPVVEPVATPEPAAPAPAARTATLYRDTWGVPHIYAETDAGAAYALGYAQAEDRIEDIYKNVRTATGRMAEAFGAEYIEQDYIMRLIRNDSLCMDYWKTAPQHFRDLVDNFMAGVKAYEAEHPEKRPEFALDLEGWQCMSIGRAMIMNWPLGTIMDDLNHKHETPDFGSNAWVVAPSRSAGGCPILLTDPHLEWEGMSVFYEARVHGDELAMNGFFLVGSPVVALGHNQHVGWGCTTGGPDTSDVYMLKINPANPTQYEYDGEWWQGEIKKITINVKDADPVSQPAIYTHLGPFMSEPDMEKGVVYVGATPYMDETDLFEQMYRMVFAQNCDEFYEALEMNQFMEQNLAFADTRGDIRYVRLGRTPIRPDGYNWRAPVHGNTSASAWLGIHDIADLVQIANPPQGYFQNCNISPELMMVDSPMTPDKYKDYIYNVTWDYTNPRGRRSVDLLSSIESMTKEQAMAVAMDVYGERSSIWQAVLKAAVDAVGAEKMAAPEFAKAINDIQAWNGEYTADSVAAPVMKFWRLKLEDAVDCGKIVEGGSLAKEDQVKLLDLLGEALAELEAKYGTLDLTWGDVHKVGRGGVLYPCDGADYAGSASGPNMTETLFDVRVEERPPGSGTYVATNGSMATMLMFLHEDGIESYTCTPWGQSADPESPHYMDQGEKLYSKRQFKPTWFAKEELLEHLESEKVLTIP